MRLPALPLLLAGVLIGCGGSPAPPPERPNLLLVTLDTTRADRLGAYGHAAAATPRLDRVAAEGALATNAFAVAPLTLPSHASILTGLEPPRHGIRDNADFRLAESETTLAEHLRSLGYRTAASVGSAVLASPLGLAQGFESYGEPKRPLAGPHAAARVGFVGIAERNARAVTEDALAALGSFAEAPFFLWVHYFDPHADYAPPEPWRSRFSDSPYDGEIAYVDSEIGRLLDAIEERGLAGRTLVVVTADHGESLGEHGEATHGLFVYDAAIRVPLLVRFPGIVRSGLRYDGLVSGVDLATTLLELMGVTALPSAAGTSHARGLSGGPLPDRPPVYAESLLPMRAYGWAPLAALRSAKEKFIDAPLAELYDVASDSGETKNLAGARPEEVARWIARLDTAVEGFGKPPEGTDRAASDEERAVLASLGYVGSASGESRSGPRPDPKGLVEVHNRYLAAQARVARGEAAAAEEELATILRDDPRNAAALALLGSLRHARGERTLGLEGLEAAARASPGVFETQRNLANAYHQENRFADAARAYRAALAIQPASAETTWALGNALYAEGDFTGAVEAYRRAIGLGVASPVLRGALGAALADGGDAAAGEREMRAAVAADPSLAESWNKLGVLADRSGRRAEAADLYERALTADPDFPDALFNRGKARLRDGRSEDAAADATRLVSRHPEYGQGWLLDASVRAATGDRAGARRSLAHLLGLGGLDPRLEKTARDMLRRLEG